MRFRTELALPASPWPISHATRIALFGSCFSARMADLLRAHKFPVSANPFGILYHPVPLLAPLVHALRGEDPYTQDSIRQGESHRHLAFHSQLQADTAEALQAQIRAAMTATRSALLAADVVVITLGSAIGYRWAADESWVGNCHGLPGKLFRKDMGSQAEIAHALDEFILTLQTYNPAARVLLTVSPVRHIRHGMLEDSLGKALLRIACQDACARHAHVGYFPAFELLQDDLRDYRFYAADMAHPSEQAVQYIWEKFAACYFSSDTQQRNDRIIALQRDLAHRPQSGGSTAYRQHLLAAQDKARALQASVDMHPELADIAARLDELGAD
jgi:hypothetical protein